MATPKDHEPLDEGEVVPLGETERPAFATVRVVEHQRDMAGQDLDWHPELHAGTKCPQCRRYTLKRNRSTVYCGFCRMRWWSKRP